MKNEIEGVHYWRICHRKVPHYPILAAAAPSRGLAATPTFGS